MHRNRQRWSLWRVVLGVTVLYALVLQGLLGGIAVSRANPMPSGILCLTGEDRAGQDRAGEERQGSAHEDEQCTSACRLAVAFAVAAPDAPSFAIRQRGPTRERLWLRRQVNGPPVQGHPSAPPRAPPVIA